MSTPQQEPPGETRLLKVEVPKEHFGVWKFVVDRTKSDMDNFVQEALKEKVSKWAVEQIAFGRNIPPFVARYLDRK